MSQVEVVALWVGLVASIVGVVLAIVSIVFTWVVNKRADEVNDQTIQSLQKIETTVAGLSEATTGLIKAAWDKLLSGVGGAAPEPVGPVVTKELAAGIAAELRADLVPAQGAGDSPAQKQASADIEAAIERLERELRAQVPTRTRYLSPAREIDAVLPRLRLLRPEAREFLYQIATRHLTRPQYQTLLMSEDMGLHIRQLRENGLIVPYSGDEGEKRVPVYFLAESLRDILDEARLLLPPVPPEARDVVVAALQRVGYSPRPDKSP